MLEKQVMLLAGILPDVRVRVIMSDLPWIRRRFCCDNIGRLIPHESLWQERQLHYDVTGQIAIKVNSPTSLKDAKMTV